VVTSHSPNFASAARVERLTVLARPTPDTGVVARSPAEFGLTERQLGHLLRLLDVTKASLLFARGVVLVEGVAEQLLVPAFAQSLDRPLSRSGVAVIKPCSPNDSSLRLGPVGSRRVRRRLVGDLRGLSVRALCGRLDRGIRPPAGRGAEQPARHQVRQPHHGERRRGDQRQTADELLPGVWDVKRCSPSRGSVRQHRAGAPSRRRRDAGWPGR